MTAMTLTEMIIARAAGLEAVKPGDEVWAGVDRIVMNDSGGPRRIGGLIEELGGMWDPSHVVLASDHFTPAANARHAEILRTTRQWASASAIGWFYEGTGILHNLALQENLVQPYMLVVGSDSHTVSMGAAGAVAFSVGSTELATVLATGQVWISVPPTLRIMLDGKLSAPVEMRDVTMHLLDDLKSNFAAYRAVEFDGEFVSGLELDERLVLSNQGIEMGATNAIVVPAADAGLSGDGAYRPAPDSVYEENHHYDVGAFVPMVALPHAPDNIAQAESVSSPPLDSAWIGSCVGGRYADLRAAALILKGRKTQIPLIITPATQAIYRRCLEDGTLQTLVEAGAIIHPPGCGACAGLHSGVLAAEEAIITTATRNFRGRMGSRDSSVYLASPYTVAASAVAGRVIDPREIAGGGLPS